MWNFHYLLARLYRHAQVRKYSVFLTTYETKYVPFKNGPVYAEFVVYCAKSLGLGPIEGIEAEIESYRMRDDQATRGVT